MCASFVADAADWEEVADALSLSEVRNRDVRVQWACALTGEGIYDAMDFLAKKIKQQKRKIKELQKSNSKQMKMIGQVKS